MKKLLIILTFVFIAGLYVSNAQCCDSKELADATASKSQIDAKESQAEVTAYYFHATRRCATCEAVEAVTKKTIEENYKGKVTFQSVNREKDENEELVKKYKINGQSLLLVKGDKKVDLTNVAFMNALTKPEKLETKLKSTIDSML